MSSTGSSVSKATALTDAWAAGTPNPSRGAPTAPADTAKAATARLYSTPASPEAPATLPTVALPTALPTLVLLGRPRDGTATGPSFQTERLPGRGQHSPAPGDPTSHGGRGPAFKLKAGRSHLRWWLIGTRPPAGGCARRRARGAGAAEDPSRTACEPPDARPLMPLSVTPVARDVRRCEEVRARHIALAGSSRRLLAGRGRDDRRARCRRERAPSRAKRSRPGNEHRPKDGHVVVSDRA
jgi:hypothetical protein